MIKKAPGTVHDEDEKTIVTWENDGGITEARVFDAGAEDEEVTDFVAALLSDDEDGEYIDNDIENGVGDVDSVAVYSASEIGTPKLQSSVTYE